LFGAAGFDALGGVGYGEVSELVGFASDQGGSAAGAQGVAARVDRADAE
jgi:hypothetical protein